jgi:DnaJ-class molecular chaperone
MYQKILNTENRKAVPKGRVLYRLFYSCAFCKGTGFINHVRVIKCNVCSGMGTVKIPTFTVTCAYCNGEGRSRSAKALTCNVCGGKGVVSINNNIIEPCHFCKGLGRERGSNLPCMGCKGKGVVPKLRLPMKM